VEKDYPLRKGLALVMICYKLQVENFSHMANELVLKIYRIPNSPRQQGMPKDERSSRTHSREKDYPPSNASLRAWRSTSIQSKKDKKKDELVEVPNESKPTEKVIIHDNHLDQPVTIGGNLTTEYQADLIRILRKHPGAFSWALTDMTGIPHSIAEHELKTYPHIEPRVQRKRSIAPDRRKVVKDEVAEWLKAEIVKWVRYPTWVANLVIVKKSDDSWRMCIDF
nr:reverse transcriptase domain-containing protein [Tanacetum cinerariifolium]